MNELFNVKGKVVVITGGAGILGKGIAAYLAKEGAKVVVLDRSGEAGKALVDSIKAEGNEAMFLYTDVMDKEVLEGNKVEIMKAYGRIDVLLNAAGGNMAGATIAPDKTFFDLQIDAFKKVVDLNLFGTVLPTMVFAEIMVEQKKGSIVNFCSESALRPLTRVVGYGAAKAAIANFTKYMAGELALKFGNGLRVNAIASIIFPGNTRLYTAMDTPIPCFLNGTAAFLLQHRHDEIIVEKCRRRHASLDHADSFAHQFRTERIMPLNGHRGLRRLDSLISF